MAVSTFGLTDQFHLVIRIGGGMIWTTKRLDGPQGLTSAATILMVAGVGSLMAIVRVVAF
jgi:uncharacterized membrane protein YhiD involved in acid resistance